MRSPRKFLPGAFRHAGNLPSVFGLDRPVAERFHVRRQSRMKMRFEGRSIFHNRAKLTGLALSLCRVLGDVEDEDMCMEVRVRHAIDRASGAMEEFTP